MESCRRGCLTNSAGKKRCLKLASQHESGVEPRPKPRVCGGWRQYPCREVSFLYMYPSIAILSHTSHVPGLSLRRREWLKQGGRSRPRALQVKSKPFRTGGVSVSLKETSRNRIWEKCCYAGVMMDHISPQNILRSAILLLTIAKIPIWIRLSSSHPLPFPTSRALGRSNADLGRLHDSGFTPESALTPKTEQQAGPRHHNA